MEGPRRGREITSRAQMVLGPGFSHLSRQVNEAKSLFCGICHFDPHGHMPQSAQMAPEDRFPGLCPWLAPPPVTRCGLHVCPTEPASLLAECQLKRHPRHTGPPDRPPQVTTFSSPSTFKPLQKFPVPCTSPSGARHSADTVTTKASITRSGPEAVQAADSQGGARAKKT